MISNLVNFIGLSTFLRILFENRCFFIVEVWGPGAGRGTVEEIDGDFSCREDRKGKGFDFAIAVFSYISFFFLKDWYSVLLLQTDVVSCLWREKARGVVEILQVAYVAFHCSACIVLIFRALENGYHVVGLNTSVGRG